MPIPEELRTAFAHPQRLGTCIIEEQEGGDCLVILPTGTVRIAGSREAAEKYCQRWLTRRRKRDVGIGMIEYRPLQGGQE